MLILHSNRMQIQMRGIERSELTLEMKRFDDFYTSEITFNPIDILIPMQFIRHALCLIDVNSR